MSNFCPMPWVHMNLKQEGKVSACWRYPDRIGDYTQSSLKEIWNGEEVVKLRQALLDGERPEGCRSCWDMEDSGVKSTRQQTTEDYKNFITEIGAEVLGTELPFNNVQSVEVRFDNICNLMCRHCSPDYSSKWEVAVKKDQALMDKMVEYGTYRKQNYHVKLTDEIINEITQELAPNLKEIMLAGGEPLYHEKHYDFIKDLLPHAKKIQLSYNSNLTTTEYKGASIIDLWKNFRRVLLRVSIDGDPSCYDYVRVHNDLQKIENNIKKVLQLSNVRLSATCTTSILNITRLTSIAEYYLSLGAYFHTSLVQYPRALNPRLLPQELKDKTTRDWNTWLEDVDLHIDRCVSKEFPGDKELHKSRIVKFGNSVIKYMNSKDEHQYWNEFVDYTKALDAYHKTSLVDVYPEFQPYFD